MTKKELRKIYNEKRNQLSRSQKEKLDDLILIQFQKMSLPNIQVVLSYWPMDGKNEINTHTITDFMMFRNPGIHIAYPVADFTTSEMKAIVTDEHTEFKKNQYNIYEPISGEEIKPDDIDIILIPMLAFDMKGHRVGYGKGFYDRYLQNAGNHLIKIGLSYFEAEQTIDDASDHDMKLDYCISPENIHDFTT